ncbi:MAG: hypothetical protein NXI01_00880 [Gammaproteobacteria bacterium]|nr:hypothetical protein [Gammaproteobacteria bacterium]
MKKIVLLCLLLSSINVFAAPWHFSANGKTYRGTLVVDGIVDDPNYDGWVDGVFDDTDLAGLQGSGSETWTEWDATVAKNDIDFHQFEHG